MRYVLLLAACLTLLVGMHLSPAGAAQVPQRERWEYATFDVSRLDGKSFYSFVASDEKYNENSINDLMTKLGGTPDLPGTYVATVNLIGKKGWEFVQLERDTSPPGETTTWHFRRQVR